MVNLSDCPAREDLRRFAVGELIGADADTVEQHLDTCERCLETLHVQESGDTLVDSLRGPIVAEAAVPDDLVEAMVQRIGALRRQPPLAKGGMGGVVGGEGPSQQTDAFNTPAIDRGIDTPTTGAEQATSDLSAADDLDFLAPAEQPGELGRLGGYRILKVLGSGGMGVVFVAEDPQLQRRVALKVMRPALAASKTARQRFLREARLAASIEHDHLVHIYQVGEDRSMPFLAMQLLKGESLEERLRREERLATADAIRIGREVAEGLAAAHGQGLIHRDIKPANVFLALGQSKAHGQPPMGFGRVKILDFGLARAVEDDAHITGSGVIAGTPAYMAPEQARAEAVDARTDLFSLGCVLYRMLVGRTPFRGASTTALLMSLASDQPAAPANINPETPKALSDLVMRLLAKNPADRPASAREVVEALAAIERQLQDDEVTRWQGDKVTTDESITVAESPAHPVTLSPLHLVTASIHRLLTPKQLIAAVLLFSLGFLSIYFGGTVIRFATNKGELIVEIHDPKIEVSVQGDVVTIHDNVKERRFILTPGKDYEVIVREPGDDGVYLVTKKFTLTRGGQERVSARMLLKDATFLPRNPPAKDADRRAAEWVLSMGGNLDLVVGGQIVNVATSAQLPAGPIQFGNISLYRHLSRPVDDAALENLRGVSGLTGQVHLRGQPITDTGLEKLAYFAGLAGLDFLNLGDTQVTDAGLAHLKRFGKLNSLGLYKTAVTDAGLDRLKSLPTLRDLDLSETRISDAGMKHLRDMPHLIELAISGTKVTDAGLEHLKALKLRTLRLRALPGVTAAGLGHLSGMSSLAYLELYGTPVGDAGLARLKSASTLIWLGLRGTKVSAEGVKKFAAALPNCTIESDHGTLGPKSPVADAPGSPGFGLNFNGKSDYVEIPGLTRLKHEPFTLEAWATPASLNQGADRTIARVIGPADVWLYSGGRDFWAAMVKYHASGDRWAALAVATKTNDVITPGKAVHLAYVIDDDGPRSVYRLFVDGQLVGSEPTKPLKETGIVNETRKLTYLGAEFNDSTFKIDKFFHGRLAEVRLSKKARYSKDFTPAKRFEPDADTLALYHCDEGQGDKLIDSSGNGHHGKIVGATWVKSDGNIAAGFDTVWLDDDLPSGARAAKDSDPWVWGEAPSFPVFSGKKSLKASGLGLHSRHFHEPKHPLTIQPGDKLFAHVWLDPNDPPRSVMLQFLHAERWDHRAYWGEDLAIKKGKPNRADHRYYGPLPPLGKWVRLEVIPQEVGLAPGAKVTGLGFTQFGGTAYYDKSGICSIAERSLPPSGDASRD